MWQDITDLTSSQELIPIHPDAEGRFRVAIERGGKGDCDRLLSGWAIVRKEGTRYMPLSALHYVDTIKARAKLPPARPRSRKGLGGFPFTSDRDDLEALDLGSVTLNIVLNDILSAEQGPDRTPYRYAGRTWYVNDRNVARYDAQMQAIARRHLMVSAIVLILPARSAPEGSWTRLAAHPDADPGGVFVMPNFTSRAGVEAYAAAMNFVAERYSRPDGKYGRVRHWIMHNEINNGFFWTTAGDKTLITYMDLYQKSLRLAYLIARQYDPNAKSFISLDHGWTNLPEKRSYAGRTLLETLVAFCRQEGDYAWGIAFHPYPQDISNPRTWEDSGATFRFDTPFLTFKNLEVLDAWARLPQVAFQGKPREIQLSEEGLNSRDYSSKSLAEQAAGLAYAWKKIEPLKTITAFQYHLWADEPSEGGLRLGLRKFANDPTDPLGKKPAWFLFQAVGTPAWDPASRFALPILGLKRWNEVHYAGKIRGGGADISLSPSP
jgi:hypothetical protein